MSKENKEQSNEVALPNQLPVISPGKVTADLLFNEHKTAIAFFEQAIFEEQTTELLSTEFWNEVIGVELQMIATKKTILTIGEESKEAVELQMLTEDGVSKKFETRFKFLQVWDMNNMNDGEVLAMKVTFLGLEKIKGAKTVNNFRIFATKLKRK